MVKVSRQITNTPKLKPWKISVNQCVNPGRILSKPLALQFFRSLGFKSFKQHGCYSIYLYLTTFINLSLLLFGGKKCKSLCSLTERVYWLSRSITFWYENCFFHYNNFCTRCPRCPLFLYSPPAFSTPPSCSQVTPQHTQSR